MSSFGSIGGLLIGIFGLLIVAYGFNGNVPFSNHAFSAGVVLSAAGGIIVWQSRTKTSPAYSIPNYKQESTSHDSRSDLKYQNIYEGLSSMLRTVNTDGIILECNPSYVKNFGFSKQDVIGRSLFEHTAEKSMEDMKKAFETWKKSGKVSNVEIWFKRKDGTIFPGLISANNIYDDNGKLIGSNTSIRDISEIYQARRVLDDHERQAIQLEELKKSESLKSDFYMTVARECQIPIEPIKKYSQILGKASKNLSDKQIEAIKEIHDNAVKLEQFMHDIITVQQLNSNAMEFVTEKFNVGIFMDGVVESCNSMMEEKKIEFVNSTSAKKLITSDKAKLNEVFSNLIQNAIDFVPTGGGRIEICAKEEDNSVLFYVKDNGIGILEKKKEFVFKKFYQVDISFKRKYGGSGFGLVICKGIIENLGGKIWFESKEGEGTTFYFTLPI